MTEDFLTQSICHYENSLLYLFLYCFFRALFSKIKIHQHFNTFQYNDIENRIFHAA